MFATQQRTVNGASVPVNGPVIDDMYLPSNLPSGAVVTFNVVRDNEGTHFEVKVYDYKGAPNPRTTSRTTLDPEFLLSIMPHHAFGAQPSYEFPPANFDAYVYGAWANGQPQAVPAPTHYYQPMQPGGVYVPRSNTPSMPMYVPAPAPQTPVVVQAAAATPPAPVVVVPAAAASSSAPASAPASPQKAEGFAAPIRKTIAAVVASTLATTVAEPLEKKCQSCPAKIRDNYNFCKPCQQRKQGKFVTKKAISNNVTFKCGNCKEMITSRDGKVYEMCYPCKLNSEKIQCSGKGCTKIKENNFYDLCYACFKATIPCISNEHGRICNTPECGRNTDKFEYASCYACHTNTRWSEEDEDYPEDKAVAAQ